MLRLCGRHRGADRMRSGKMREGPPGALTRERILDAAKEMFARRGVEAVSLRELTIKAGVNLAAVHYHFGSKEGVLAELFARSSKAIVKWRLDLLAKVRRHRDGRPYLEDVLEGFLRPSLAGAGRAARRADVAAEDAHER